MTISLARANGSTVEISFGAVLSQDPPEHLSKAFSAVNALEARRFGIDGSYYIVNKIIIQ